MVKNRKYEKLILTFIIAVVMLLGVYGRFIWGFIKPSSQI